LGVLKSVVERRDEYLADELPNVLHEQLITQKDIYDVLSDMYKSLTGNKHQSKHDEERELKWDSIAGTYLSPDAKREQLEWIKSQVSNTLKQQHKELNKNVEGIGLVDWLRRTAAKWGSDHGFMDTFEDMADLTKGLGNEIEELLKNSNLSKTTYQDLFEKLRGQEFHLGNHEEILAALKSLYENGNPEKQQKAKIEEEEEPLKPSIMSNFCDCISQIPDLLRKEPLPVDIVSVSDEFCRKCLSPPQDRLALPYSPGQTVDSLFSFNSDKSSDEEQFKEYVASIANKFYKKYFSSPPLEQSETQYLLKQPVYSSYNQKGKSSSSGFNPSDSSYHNTSILINPSNCIPVKFCDDSLLDFSNALASSILKAVNKQNLKKKEVDSYDVTIKYLPEIHNTLAEIEKHEEGQSETKNKKFSFLSYIKSFLSEKFLSGIFKELFDKGIKNFILDIIKSDINTVKRIGLGAIESVINKIKGVKDAGLNMFKSVVDKIKGVKDAGLNMFKSGVDKIKGVKDAGLNMFKSGVDKIKSAKDAGLLSAKNVFSTIKGVGLGTAETVMNAVKSVKTAGLSGIFNMIMLVKR
jgi:hypothetical protein